MKVVILHPPLYPTNHKFFNELGKHMDLVVFCFGNHPGLHDQWKAKHFVDPKNNYVLRIIDGKTNLRRKAVSYRTQLNPTFLLQVKKEKPDVVISIAFWFPSLYMSLFKPLFKCKFLIMTDAIEQTEKNSSAFRNALRRVIAKNVDAFIACSDLTVSYLKGKFPNRPIRKSFQTIDVLEWQNDIENLPSKTLLRQKLNLPKEKTIILSIGNFIPLKNLEKLIDNVISIPNCELLLIGEGELKQHFETKIKNNDVAHKIKLIPRQGRDELKQYYKVSDVFVFPSNRDTFGYVVLEALASGLPVVCSKNAGASSIIQDGENGFVVNPKDDFTNEISAVISKLSEMKSKTQNSVASYTLANRANEFSDMMDTIIKKQ